MRSVDSKIPKRSCEFEDTEEELETRRYRRRAVDSRSPRRVYQGSENDAKQGLDKEEDAWRRMGK